MRTNHNASVEILSPLGNFPQARVLFDNADHAITQGNSRSETNSPKVRSVMSFHCSVCHNVFGKNNWTDFRTLWQCFRIAQKKLKTSILSLIGWRGGIWMRLKILGIIRSVRLKIWKLDMTTIK